MTRQILEYTKSGAVKRLQRRGRKNDGKYGKVDNLHITVKGNRLHYVSDDADFDIDISVDKK